MLDPKPYTDVVVRIQGLKSEYVRYMYPNKTWSFKSEVISWRKLLTKDEVDTLTESMIRAAGDCICHVCSLEYNRHPDNIDILYYYPNFHLNSICNGLLVKL